MENHFITEVNDTVKKLDERATEHTFRFSVMTDSHVDPLNPKFVSRQTHAYENMQAVHQQTQIDAIFHLGDILFVCAQPEVKEQWDTPTTEKWLNWTKEQLCAANPNTFFVAGNHDSEWAEEPVPEVFYQRMIAFQKDRITGLVENKPYYYVDFPEKKVRCICLMSSFRENGKRFYGYYPEQMKWLAEEALRAPDGWGIFLFTHIQPGYVSKYNGPKDNGAEFARFLWAFHNKEKNDCPLFPADFTDAGTAKLIAMFVGHEHCDWIQLPGKLPCCVIEVGCNLTHVPKHGIGWGLPNGCSVPRRAYNTVEEDLWDTVVYDPENQTLELIRFGAGGDRHISLDQD